MVAEQAGVPGRYVLDNAGAQVPDRFAALATIYDPGTVRHLAALGVGAGWRCLEVGAGGGSVARWLSERAGPGGYVLATDVDIRHLGWLDLPNGEVRRHDITTDPLPAAAFDLIHTRLVLGHLPGRETALRAMVGALRPGGWLLLEEFDAESMPADATLNPAERHMPLEVLQRRLMTARGVDLSLGRTLPGRLEAHGLVEVEAEGQVFLWRGASPSARLRRANYEQLREAMLATNELTPEVFDAELAVLEDRAIMTLSPVLWAVRGRRPHG